LSIALNTDNNFDLGYKISFFKAAPVLLSFFIKNKIEIFCKEFLETADIIKRSWRHKMLTQEIRSKYLVDELQLGDTLNEAVHNGFKAQFDLLVSMLSSDVQDHAWVVDPAAKEQQKEDLRKKFELGNPVRLQSDEQDLERANELGEQFREGGLTAVHLLQCLNPEPLTLKHNDIPKEIIESLSPLKQEKYRYENEVGRIARVSYKLSPKEVLDNVVDARDLRQGFSAAA
jgi:hypothetical protein